MTPEQIAQICHEANRTYCWQQGDFSQQPWHSAEAWQRESAIKGVQFAIDNPNARPSGQHEAWLKDKVSDGWKYAPIKNAEAKEHPCLVPYDELPEGQKRKDLLFLAIVRALALPL